MKHVAHASLWIALCAATATAATGCVETTTTAWTTTAAADWTEYGQVESVQQVVRRVHGDPVGGAIAGALIGSAIVGGHDTATAIGAVAGAAIGASASQRDEVTRSFHVRVRFESGASRVFVFRDQSPFWPGDPVVLTPRGLLPG